MRPPSPELFIGVDVQVRRGCPYYVLSSTGDHVESGWMPAADAPARLRDLVRRLSGPEARRVAVGIDAPRMPLPAPRRWSWSGKDGVWSPSAPAAVGSGRHCEVVISAHRLANPQWTPVAATAPAWMQLGFALFDVLQQDVLQRDVLREHTSVHEIFPSAAYQQLAGDHAATFTLSVGGFLPGPKDMLDAALGAFVVREFWHGRGCEVGGGDGLGTIVLPRPLPLHVGALHAWPEPVAPAASTG
ncbi:MAG: hypothetical protein V4617_13295 [Gemmatimonadota bacterium]